MTSEDGWQTVNGRTFKVVTISPEAIQSMKNAALSGMIGERHPDAFCPHCNQKFVYDPEMDEYISGRETWDEHVPYNEQSLRESMRRLKD